MGHVGIADRNAGLLEPSWLRNETAPLWPASYEKKSSMLKRSAKATPPFLAGRFAFLAFPALRIKALIVRESGIALSVRGRVLFGRGELLLKSVEFGHGDKPHGALSRLYSAQLARVDSGGFAARTLRGVR